MSGGDNRGIRGEVNIDEGDYSPGNEVRHSDSVWGVSGHHGFVLENDHGLEGAGICRVVVAIVCTSRRHPFAGT